MCRILGGVTMPTLGRQVIAGCREVVMCNTDRDVDREDAELASEEDGGPAEDDDDPVPNDDGKPEE